MRTTVILTSIIVLILVVDRMSYHLIEILDSQVVTGQSVGKVNRFFDEKDDLDLIVFGSSRANHHVVTSLITPRSYNIGIDGTGPKTASILIDRLAPGSQLILFHIDYAEIFNRHYVGDDAFRLINKAIEFPEIDRELTEIDPARMRVAHALNLSVYRNKLLGIIFNSWFPKDDKELLGYEPLMSTAGDRLVLEPSVGAKVVDKPAHVPELNLLVDQEIDKIIDVARNKRKTLMFFTAPNIPPLSAVKKHTLRRFFEAKGAIYRDFSGYSKKLTSATYWKDHSHLSDKGARQFTVNLRNWVCGQSPTLREPLLSKICSEESPAKSSRVGGRNPT